MAKSNAGRPPAFETNQELEEKIQEYFDNLPTKSKVIDGERVEIQFASVTGLALHLGFASRQSFYDYEKKDEFTYTIKRARTLIENEYEFLLQHGNVTGAIFALKNFGWADKQQIEHSEKVIDTGEDDW